MCEKIPHLKVVGADDRIPKLNYKVKDGDKFKIGQLDVLVRFVPCHTSGHVYYIVSGGEHQPLALFSGDTLFIAGCGKFFEGTADQMRYALMEIAAQLPGDTQVWCGHEYTVSNLKFAATIDVDNAALKEKYVWALQKREKGEFTIPSTIEQELSYNPFMRVNLPDIKTAVGNSDDTDTETMTKLRERKNIFK